MSLLHSALPLVAAPMAGGPTTVALARAVTASGGFPFLAAGYKSTEAMSEEIEALRADDLDFGINLFVPNRTAIDEGSFRAYAAELAPEADAYGIALDDSPVTDDDHWTEKVDALLARPVPVVSLTFGLPRGDEIARLQRAGSRVLATVTTLDEALAAGGAGVDGLVVQGADAGGHAATHDPAAPLASVTLTDLIDGIAAAVPLPLIAAGGVDGPASVQRLLRAGAEAVAVGTLLLRADEAGTSAPHRRALADPAFTETVRTSAFTGRPARALRNGFIDRHDARAPRAYPAVHHLTRTLRQAAARADDTDRLHLWAGTGFRSARDLPAADIVRGLAEGL